MELLHRTELALKQKFATPFLRRLLRRPTYSVTRSQIAAPYLRGEGIEIGAHDQPLPLPAGTRVRYVDIHSAEGHSVQAPDVIANFESLSGIADSSCDFVIANHVLEHVENPLQALISTNRVLKPDGTAFIALPDKERSFDRPREVTPLDHLVHDFKVGPLSSRRNHYLDWAKNVEHCRGERVTARAAELEAAAAAIHFHVWDLAAMAAMFAHAEGFTGLRVVRQERNRGEIIWILCKSA
jgi:SAM-dependent methyltransferase